MASRNKARKWLERTLLTAGVLGLGAWAGSKIIPPLWQAWQNGVFERELHSRLGTRQSEPSAVAPKRRVENGHVLGRLSIPRLQISSMVREGDDETTLSLALGHIPGTAFPGEAGNVGVAGHRDTIFRPLREIHKDDLIRFETLEGTRVYAVDSTRIVKPDDVSVLQPQKTPGLTLVTCYPFYYIGSAPDRFIVSAHEVPAASARTQPDETPEPQTKAALRPAVLESAPVPARAAGDQPARFTVAKGHAQQVAPGISLGVTDTDPRNGSVYGWMILPDQRTILLRDQLAGEPLVFYQDGQRRELRFTGVFASAATGSISTPVR